MTAVPADLEFTRIYELVAKSRLVDRAAVDKLSTRLRKGEYSLILGARFSEKSFLLDDIAQALASDPEVVPIRVDLGEFRHEAGGRFISRFAETVRSAAGIETAIPRQERPLVQFLKDVPVMRQRHVILLLDHLELLPVNDILVLLRTLRGVFTEQSAGAQFPLTCAAATSFAVASLTFEPNSPFNKGHHHWLEDLDRAQSHELFSRIAETLQVSVDDAFFERLFAVTGGDRYLIALLCNCCASIAASDKRQTLSVDDCETAEDWFLKRAEYYPPLQETMRALEQPDVLRMFVQVLADGRVEEKDLEVRGDQGSDALRLTGGVRRVVEADGRTFYELRNDLVRRFMETFYNPVRVARVFFMAGQVTDAVEYLARQPDMPEERRLRRAFLDAVGAAINAALTVKEAVKDLAQHIVRAFGASSAAAYIVSADRRYLECVSAAGQKAKRMRMASRESAVFREGQYRMKHDKQQLTLVLTSLAGVRFGIIDVHGFRGDAQSEDFSLIFSVVRQIGWALGNVIERDHLIRQLQTLAESSQLSSSLDLERVLKAVVDAGIKAVPGAQRGLLLLYDETTDLLRVASKSEGFQESIAEQIRLHPGEGYAGKVFQTGMAEKIDNVPNSNKVLLRHVPDVAKQKSAVCVPLFGWGRTIGVFILDNITELAAFRDKDQELLATFAAQAAMALQNAMVYRGLYELSLKVNRGTLHSEEIFHEAARTVVHVTGAFGANLLVLRDPDDLQRKPLMSFVYNMSKDFEEAIRPREDGLTMATLKSGGISICSSPEQPPGIHPLALAEGVRAVIALPLTLQGQIRGVMFVLFRRPHEFSPEEKSVLSIFANLCAEAIDETRHAEQRGIHASVAWMGLDLSETVHSIAQLLPALQIYPNLLRRGISGNDTALAQLSKIEEAVALLAKIPYELLPLEENIQPEDLVALVREQVQEWTKAQQDSIRVDLSELNLSPINVKCDARRLSKVVKCLTENAVRAAKNADSKWIKVTLRPSSRLVDVVITNSGPAIPEDIQADLFKKPVRSSSSGRGVGLLIARSIVIGYDGDLELLYSTEVETAFRLSIPRAREQEAS